MFRRGSGGHTRLHDSFCVLLYYTRRTTEESIVLGFWNKLFLLLVDRLAGILVKLV